jgi:sugar/nucleoside kinase (ribokinase family)
MIERDGGRRTFFHHVGANGALTWEDVDLAGTSARVLHLGAPGLHPLLDGPARRDDAADGANGWSRLLAEARRAGLRTNLEMVDLPAARQQALVLPCLPHLDSIVVNELEAGSLTGIEAPVAGPDASVDWDALEASAARLVDLGVQGVAVIHFPAGAVAATADGRTFRQGSVRVPRAEVVSTIGAGDATAAGVVYGLHEGWDVARCLRLGVSSAAACLRGANTSDGLGPAQECLALGERYGFRPVV